MVAEPYDLRIVGPSEDDLREIKACHGGRWSQRIMGEGKVSESRLDHLIQHAKWGLYLSLYEGFGLPPLEFMSRGIPVIASSATSVPESVGDAGILVDPFDYEGIAATLLKVTQDPEMAVDLIQKGFLRAGELSWITSAKQLTETLERILTSEELTSLGK
jgi:glycosyltransferase involved in cell wall biosynthesis